MTDAENEPGNGPPLNGSTSWNEVQDTGATDCAAARIGGSCASAGGPSGPSDEEMRDAGDGDAGTLFKLCRTTVLRRVL